MTNPVWQWLFRGRVDPYHANERFRGWAAKRLGPASFPDQPRWAGCRLGQSKTTLRDGRVFWIAGEHEDFYDPDFYIYNDVIIEHPDGRVEIVGYPEASFRPTDFHTATAIDSSEIILLIGNMGYEDQRDVGRTQVYALNTQTLSIDEIQSSGNAPGWINAHNSTLSDDRTAITVRGGNTMTDDGFLENIDEWSLSLTNHVWTRLTERKWVRFQVGRVDGDGLHLWQYTMQTFATDYPQAGLAGEPSLAEAIGGEPDLIAFNGLYTPPVEHIAIERDLENEDDWKAQRILVGDVRVRYSDEMEHLLVTVEGDLTASIIDGLANDLQAKLERVENSACQIKWISTTSNGG